MKSGAGVVCGIYVFLMCCRFALGRLAIVSLEENFDMFLDACVTDVKLSRAANVILDVVEKVTFESV